MSNDGKGKNEDQVKKMLSETDPKRLKLDAKAKELLSEKPILAGVLQPLVPEYKDLEPPDVEALIEPGSIGSHVDSRGNEYFHEHGTKQVLDLVFHAVFPESERDCDAVLDIEPHVLREGIDELICKGSVYMSDLVGTQSGRFYTSEKYADLRSVYSIWICFEAPESIRGSIIEYRLPDDANPAGFGDEETQKKLASVQNKQNLIIIAPGEPVRQDNAALGMLGTLFSTTIPYDEKIRVLRDKYKIRVSDKIKKEVSNMFSYSEVVWDQATDAAWAAANKKLEEKDKKLEEQDKIIQMYEKKYGKIEGLPEAESTSVPDED